jgi:TolB-like protein/tetratricopeptide (TPR) repeat protein
MTEVPAPPGSEVSPRGEDRLDSWKEIAAYLRRGVRTVRRWEKEEGLPVHRHQHQRQGSVYAYKSEVDAWWDARRVSLEHGEEPEGPRLPRKRALPWSLGAAVAAAAVLYLILAGRPPPEGRLMLAVLPLENLSGDPEQEYLSDGMTEDLITELGRLSPGRLGVIARSSAMLYKGTRKRPDEIARELGVDYLLEGSVRRVGSRLRIAAQLIRPRDQTHLWAESYDREASDILRVQAEVARAVATEIHSHLSETYPSPLVEAAITPEAHEAYLRGRYLADRRTGASVLEARRWFERAIAASPDYARAYVGLADTHLLAITYADAPTDESVRSAREAVMKALDLNERLPDAHAWLGVILTEHDWDWSEAEKDYRRAIELDPNFAYAHKLYAEFLTYVGRFEEAVGEARVAIRLDPRSVVTHSMLGIALYSARRYEEAIPVLRETLSLDPAHPLPYLPLGLAYAQRGDYENAVSALEKARTLSAESSESLGQLAYVYGKAGNAEKSHELLEEMSLRSEKQYVSPFYFAVAHTGVGELDRAIYWLEKGYQERIWLMCVVKTEPIFDPLRPDDRFQSILSRMHFPE